jgi:hypothetical protein
MSNEPQWTLRMVLEDPFGRHSYSVAMPIDAFDARDRLVNLRQPSEFDRGNFDSTVQLLKKKEYRKDLFEDAARSLGRKLGERMEDEEGWHGISRQETYEQRRRDGKF